MLWPSLLHFVSRLVVAILATIFVALVSLAGGTSFPMPLTHLIHNKRGCPILTVFARVGHDAVAAQGFHSSRADATEEIPLLQRCASHPRNVREGWGTPLGIFRMKTKLGPRHRNSELMILGS
jgi:hypothetical protein